jgi:hypothetical protein
MVIDLGTACVFEEKSTAYRMFVWVVVDLG